jgi:hypothetical protein
MKDKISQHYIPIFYLKNFSYEQKGIQLSMFNKPSDKYIESASLESQASEKFMYGSDGKIETDLANLESETALVFTSMIKQNDHPKYSSNEHYLILSFTVALAGRTMQSADELNDMATKFARKIAEKHPQLKNHAKNVHAHYKLPAVTNLGMTLEIVPLTLDLAFKLIINKSTNQFITSDNPVVLYNQFFENKNCLDQTGFASKGLQIFLPISPTHLLVFFDRDVYKVGGICHKPIVINNSSDINNLNCLQIINSRENIYFNENINENYVRNLYIKSVNHLSASRVLLKEYPGATDEKGIRSSLLRVSRKSIKCNLQLTFVSLTKKAKKFKLGNMAVYVRNEGIVIEHHKFLSLVKEGLYQSNEFFQYLRDLKELKVRRSTTQ